MLFFASQRLSSLLQPGPSSFPEGTSSPDGLHAANCKGNPGSVKAGAKTSLIAAMPGSHQMSGFVYPSGGFSPGLFAGRPWPSLGVTAPLPPPQEQCCFWRSSGPQPHLWLTYSQCAAAREEKKCLIRLWLSLPFRSCHPDLALGSPETICLQLWRERCSTETDRQTHVEKMVWASRNLVVKERQEYASNLIFSCKTLLGTTRLSKMYSKEMQR